MKKPRVLLVVRHPVGGIRTFFRYVYTKFDPNRYEFTLIAPDVPETRVLLQDLASHNWQFISVNRYATDVEFFRTITKALKHEGFDLVHSHGFTSAACSVLGAAITKTPHICTAHDVFTPKQFPGLIGLGKRIGLGAILAAAKCVHCVTEDARSNLLGYLGILRLVKKKVVVIQNGIETGRFLNAEERKLRQEYDLGDDVFIIGFLGRFMAQKGIPIPA